MVWTQSSFPLLIVTSGSGFTGLFVYSPIPGTGNLLASVTAQASTDPFGNPYQASITAYQLGLPRVNARLSAGAVIFNRGAVVNAPAVVGSNDSAALVLSSGSVNASDVGSSVVLIPALAGAVPVVLMDGALEIEEGPVPAADGNINAGPKLFGGTNGHAGVVDDALNGDSVAYQLGENVMVKTSAQVVSSTSNVGITPLSQHVAAGGTYEFSGKLRIKQNAVANATQNIGFTGPATSYCDWFWTTSTNAGTTTSQDTVQGSLVPVGVDPGGTNNELYFTFQGTVTFSAGGTFQGAASAFSAIDNFTLQPGCLMKVRRVS